jgi:hypothetical protein
MDCVARVIVGDITALTVIYKDDKLAKRDVGLFLSGRQQYSM